MAVAALPFTYGQPGITAAFRRAPELQNLLLHDVQETGHMLGTGSYGSVIQLRFGATLCAGKKIHESLIDIGNVGAEVMVSNFLEECKLMSELRHPRIVQFMGVCLLPCSTIPILVMELLSDCLENIIETRENLPLALKQSILTDVASALVFMHSRIPPIIHRDLTAKNVLIDEASMKAKVSDLGNSRFIARKEAMTRAPGTLVYMPPEALGENPRYCDKLDMFSFGHLALYTIIQVSPEDLLTHNICNPHNEKLIPRTEVERRSRYMELLHETLSEKHSLVKLVKQCLNNAPQKRPTAMEALHWLEDADYEVVLALHRGQMVDIISRKEQEIENLRRQIDSRNSIYDMIPQPADVGGKSGPLEKLLTSGITKLKKWKSYTFTIKNETHLKYFKSGTTRPRGEIILSTVTDVITVAHASGKKHCFEIYFNGRDSPWALAAYTESERESWMGAILRKQQPRNIMQNSAYGLIPLDTELEFANLAPQNELEVADDPMYDVISRVPDDKPQPKVKPEPPALPHHPLDLGRSITDCTPNVITDKMKRSSGTNDSQKEQVIPPSNKSLADLWKTTQVVSRKDSDYEKTFATLSHRATNFTPSQIDHLISMLKNTQGSVLNNVAEDTQQEREEGSPRSTTPQPPQAHYVNYLEVLANGRKTLHEERGKECKIQPCSGSLPSTAHYVNYLEIYGHGRGVSHCGVPEHGKDSTMSPRPRSTSPTSRNAHYVNYCKVMEDSAPIRKSPPPLRSRSHNNLATEVSESGRKKSKHPMPPPKPSIFSKPTSTHFHLQPKQDTPNNSKRLTLKKVLKQTSLTQDPESLLVTEEDSPENYSLRPDWAKANTSHPRPSTLVALHRRALYISPTALVGITELGEGQFGTVYRAQMKRSQQSASAHVTVAVKTVAQITLDFKKEVTIMSEVIHPNIIRLYGLINEGEMAPAMVMEYLPNEDLKKFLSNDEVVEKVTGGYRMPVPRCAPQLVIRIMKACWNSEPGKRPSFLLISNLLTGQMI